MENQFEGSAIWIFPDHFDVDLIIGVQNVRENDIDKLVPICMNTFEQDFVSKVKPGDIFVGGRNFGYGHAHPQAMAAVRKTGINIVLAESFAPGFFRGELGNGMMLLQVPGIANGAKRFDRLRVEFNTGLVHNLTQKTTINGIPPSPMAVRLASNKGYLGFLQEELKKGHCGL
jgi:3-isopropylmalate/(R)-2-methylmalate dehydratase small subunit